MDVGCGIFLKEALTKGTGDGSYEVCCIARAPTGV